MVAQTVQARVRLSDETTFSEGTVRVVDAEGAFAWQRATSKRISVYFATTEGIIR